MYTEIKIGGTINKRQFETIKGILRAPEMDGQDFDDDKSYGITIENMTRIELDILHSYLHKNGIEFDSWQFDPECNSGGILTKYRAFMKYPYDWDTNADSDREPVVAMDRVKSIFEKYLNGHCNELKGNVSGAQGKSLWEFKQEMRELLLPLYLSDLNPFSVDESLPETEVPLDLNADEYRIATRFIPQEDSDEE